MPATKKRKRLLPANSFYAVLSSVELQIDGVTIRSSVDYVGTPSFGVHSLKFNAQSRGVVPAELGPLMPHAMNGRKVLITFLD